MRYLLLQMATSGQPHAPLVHITQEFHKPSARAVLLARILAQELQHAPPVILAHIV